MIDLNTVFLNRETLDPNLNSAYKQVIHLNTLHIKLIWLIHSPNLN